MGQLDSTLDSVEIETLVDAVSDWESVGNYEFYLLNHFKTMPMPPEEHPAYEAVQQVKDHLLAKEKEIKDARALRRERAIFLKAKLMLIKQDLGVSQLFDNASKVSSVEATPPPLLQKMLDDTMGKLSVTINRLNKANEYMKEVGCYTNFLNYLQEKESEEAKHRDRD